MLNKILLKNFSAPQVTPQVIIVLFLKVRLRLLILKLKST